MSPPPASTSKGLGLQVDTITPGNVVLEIDALALCILDKYFIYIGVLPVCMFV